MNQEEDGNRASCVCSSFSFLSPRRRKDPEKIQLASVQPLVPKTTRDCDVVPGTPCDRKENSANKIVKAIEDVLKEGKVRTKDLGGSATTSDMGDAIVERLKKL